MEKQNNRNPRNTVFTYVDVTGNEYMLHTCGGHGEQQQGSGVERLLYNEESASV